MGKQVVTLFFIPIGCIAVFTLKVNSEELHFSVNLTDDTCK